MYHDFWDTFLHLDTHPTNALYPYMHTGHLLPGITGYQCSWPRSMVTSMHQRDSRGSFVYFCKDIKCSLYCHSMLTQLQLKDIKSSLSSVFIQHLGFAYQLFQSVNKPMTHRHCIVTSKHVLDHSYEQALIYIHK